MCLQNQNFVIDLAPVNTDIMNSDIRSIYKNLGVNCSGILIFGDTVRRPWTLTFNQNYIYDRIVNGNTYTKNLLDKCMALAEPPLSDKQYTQLQKLIKLYVAPGSMDKDFNTSETNNSRAENKNAENIIYTVEEHLLKQNGITNDLNEDGEKRYGIWSEVPGKLSIILI